MFLRVFTFFTFLFYTIASGSEFTLTLQENEIATAFCLLTGQDDVSFAKTIPELKIGKNGKIFQFTNARPEIGDRFNGFHTPDEHNAMELIGMLTIRDYSSSDLELGLICQQILNNDTLIQLPLTLDSKYSTLSSSPTHPVTTPPPPTTTLQCDNGTVLVTTIVTTIVVTFIATIFILLFVVPKPILICIFLYKHLSQILQRFKAFTYIPSANTTDKRATEEKAQPSSNEENLY
ncbi:hypothetical protein LOD99_16071 [Oopsacas minuta]|uniref:Uncharacterized protein n=1 Tax=Oopsacas minuta TaxID=111878 RepID=A0AAV7K7M8_9METZ|nr:hypothetical protein LOD99_16071 [Oopsacas minuta]